VEKGVRRRGLRNSASGSVRNNQDRVAWMKTPADPESASADGNGKRIACVDLNGVLDAYSGWQGATHFDPPRPGAREFLTALRQRDYHIVIFTTRYAPDVQAWVDRYGMADLIDHVTDRKPAAHVFVDDRAVCFRGDFDATLRDIDAFSAHWEPAREETS
jgi:hypothetical protein